MTVDIMQQAIEQLTMVEQEIRTILDSDGYVQVCSYLEDDSLGQDAPAKVCAVWNQLEELRKDKAFWQQTVAASVRNTVKSENGGSSEATSSSAPVTIAIKSDAPSTPVNPSHDYPIDLTCVPDPDPPATPNNAVLIRDKRGPVTRTSARKRRPLEASPADSEDSYDAPNAANSKYYKRFKALESQINFLYLVTERLSYQYTFGSSTPHPLFGDVLKAVGFRSDKDIDDYFATKR